MNKRELKQLEKEDEVIFENTLPLVARLDGKNFSKITKCLEKPFDRHLGLVMRMCTMSLMKDTGADIGYTQSDEISLIWLPDVDNKKELYHGGKQLKIVSDLASRLTWEFKDIKNILNFNDAFVTKKHLFDCRVFSMPDNNALSYYLIDRRDDCMRNGIYLATRCYYSHQELLGKPRGIQLILLGNKGINFFEHYPDHFKVGATYFRKKELTKFTQSEISDFPEHHEARTNPNLEVERSVIHRQYLTSKDSFYETMGKVLNVTF